MKYLVFVADDFGLCPGVNKGCLEAYQNGLVTELSLMIGWPGTNEAINMVKQATILDVGIHLTLNSYNQTTQYFRTADYKELLENKSEEELQSIVSDELVEFEELLGHVPSHITSHQHTHQHPKLATFITSYARENNIFVRSTPTYFDDKNIVRDNSGQANLVYKSLGKKYPDYFFGHVSGEFEEVKKSLLEELQLVKDNSLTEIMLHPGSIDEFLREKSTMLDERVGDVKLSQDSDFKKKIKEMGFEVVSYSDINLYEDRREKL